MKTQQMARLLLLCLLAGSAQVAAADSEGGPLRFTVRVGASIKAPVSGRLLVFLGPLQSASEEISPAFGAGWDKVWIAAREASNVTPDNVITLHPAELAFPAQ